MTCWQVFRESLLYQQILKKSQTRTNKTLTCISNFSQKKEKTFLKYNWFEFFKHKIQNFNYMI